MGCSLRGEYLQDINTYATERDTGCANVTPYSMNASCYACVESVLESRRKAQSITIFLDDFAEMSLTETMFDNVKVHNFYEGTSTH